jgi:hypothetical protein
MESAWLRVGRQEARVSAAMEREMSRRRVGAFAMALALVGLLLLFAPAGGSQLFAATGCVWAWRDVASPIVPEGSLVAVAADSASDAWAVGTIGGKKIGGQKAPLVEHWDGERWSVASVGEVQGSLAAVAASSSRDVWAAGESDSKAALLMHWDGVAWAQVALPYLPALTSVSSLGPDDVWVAGAGVVAHWDGSGWAVELSRSGVRIEAVTAISPRDVWAVGLLEAWQSERAGALHWDGAGWRTYVLSDGNHDADLDTVAAASSSDVWVGGSESLPNSEEADPLLLRWNGTRWAKVKPPFGDAYPAAIAPVSARQLWLLETDFYYPGGGLPGFNLARRDSGAWHVRTTLDYTRELFALAAIPSTKGGAAVWAVGDLGAGDLDDFPVHTLPLTRRFDCWNGSS